MEPSTFALIDGEPEHWHGAVGTPTELESPSGRSRLPARPAQHVH